MKITRRGFFGLLAAVALKDPISTALDLCKKDKKVDFLIIDVQYDFCTYQQP